MFVYTLCSQMFIYSNNFTTLYTETIHKWLRVYVYVNINLNRNEYAT